MKSRYLTALLVSGMMLLAPAALADATGDLLEAIDQGNSKLAEAAIQKGADVDAKLVDGRSPMHWAVQFGNKAFIELLLAKGADLEIGYGDSGATPLMSAVEYDNQVLIDFLLAKGAKIDATDVYGNTAFLHAVSNNRPVIAKALAARGANLQARDKNGVSALGKVLDSQSQELLGWLVEQGLDIEAPLNEYGSTPLHQAAGAGKIDVMKLLLAKGAKVDSRNRDGGTPLLAAADLFGGDVEQQTQTLALLLDKGADIEAQNSKGQTALQLIAATSWQTESAALLLERGANPEARDAEGKTALMLAISGKAVPGMISLLLDKGASPKAQDNDGSTPLMYLASVSCNDPALPKAYADLASRMIDLGADPEARDNGGQTALFYAAGLLTHNETPSGPCTEGADMIERLIARGATVDARVPDGYTPLMNAVSQSPAKVEALIRHGAQVNARAEDGSTALHYIVEDPGRDALGIARILLLKGADPAAKDKDGTTPLKNVEEWETPNPALLGLLRNAKLNLAARPLEARLLEAIAGEDLAVFTQALAQARNPNAQDEAGTTALMLAAKAGHSEMVKLLLAKGADPKRVDLAKMSALHHLYANYLETEIRIAIVKQLLAKGADPSARNAAGDTVLMAAVSQEAESNADIPDAAWTAFYKSLMVKGMNLDARIQAYPATGNTLLFEATRAENLPLLRLLLERGAKPDASTESGLTPLMAAAAKDPAIVDLLLKRGANAKAKGPDSWTVLMNAAAAGADQNVRLLLAKGAPLEAIYEGDGDQDPGGQTALLIAAANGHASTVKLLLEKGARRDVIDRLGRNALLLAAYRFGYRIQCKSESDQASDISNRLDDSGILGKLDVVQLLLDQGFDPDFKDKQGRTALNYAEEYAESRPGSPPDNYQALINLIRSARK